MSCPKCHDTGYIEDRANSTFNNWCDCPIGQKTYVENWIQKLERAEIPSEFWTLKYNDFCPQPGFTSHMDFRRTLESFLKNIKDHRRDGTIWLICGESGVGKTLGGALVLKQALKKDFSAKYVVWTDIIDATLRDHDRDVLEDLRDVDFLVIDDLGNDKINNNRGSNFASDLLEKIIKPRYSNKKPTILISAMLEGLSEKFPILPRMVPREWCSLVKGVSFRTNKLNLPPTNQI